MNLHIINNKHYSDLNVYTVHCVAFCNFMFNDNMTLQVITLVLGNMTFYNYYALDFFLLYLFAGKIDKYNIPCSWWQYIYYSSVYKYRLYLLCRS